MVRIGRTEYSPQFLALFFSLSAITIFALAHAVQGELPLEGGGPKLPPAAPPETGHMAKPEPQPLPDPEPRPNRGTKDYWKDY